MSTLSGGPNIVTNGLIFYLDATNTKSYPRNGNTWYDLCIGRNNGTLVNGPTFNSDNGGSILFNGNKYVIIPSSSFILGTSSCTLNVWTRISSSSSNYALCLSCGIGSSSGLLYCGYVSGVQYGTSNTLGGGGYGQNIGTGVYPDNKWHYITVVSNGGNPSLVSVFIDGSFKISANIPLNITSNIVKIGAGDDGVPTSPSYVLNGDVSSAQIYNRPLNDVEILQNYNATRSRFGL